MKRKIKFRQVFLNNKDNMFSHFSYWGINYPQNGINTFPGSSSNAYTDAHNSHTGLKDKNGKDIYEGDILDVGGYRETVKWDIGDSVSCGHGDSTTIIHAGFFIWIQGDTREGMDEVEIIGNIYENPNIYEN